MFFSYLLFILPNHTGFVHHRGSFIFPAPGFYLAPRCGGRGERQRHRLRPAGLVPQPFSVAPGPCVVRSAFCAFRILIVWLAVPKNLQKQHRAKIGGAMVEQIGEIGQGDATSQRRTATEHLRILNQHLQGIRIPPPVDL
jgi:hypothetical protein